MREVLPEGESWVKQGVFGQGKVETFLPGANPWGTLPEDARHHSYSIKMFLCAMVLGKCCVEEERLLE